MYLNQPKMEAQKNTACESDKILAFLKLNKHYFSGSGDWLSYLDDIGNERRVLDLCGSYGINLLGHPPNWNISYVRIRANQTGR